MILPLPLFEKEHWVGYFLLPPTFKINPKWIKYPYISKKVENNWSQIPPLGYWEVASLLPQVLSLYKQGKEDSKIIFQNVSAGLERSTFPAYLSPPHQPNKEAPKESLIKTGCIWLVIHSKLKSWGSRPAGERQGREGRIKNMVWIVSPKNS